MNKKQKIALSIGIGLVILSGLFPPYYGIEKREGDDIEENLGFAFIFSPPNSVEVAQSFHPSEYSYYSGGDPAHLRESWESKILLSQYIIQLFTIITVTLGIVFLLNDSKKQIQSPLEEKKNPFLK